jgi:predicted phage gp36 major capsid-like protein
MFGRSDRSRRLNGAGRNVGWHFEIPDRNVRMQDAGWGCDASCFANNPQPDLQPGLGELEIKCEPLRYVVCAGNDLLSDAAFNIEAWIFRKVSQGFRNNQRSFAMLLTSSDAAGRPLFGQLPSGLPGYLLAGSPIQIVTQMPDCAPGSPPVAFGNWQEAYCVVTRQGTTMRPDPYSAGGWCVLYRFEARVGGSTHCPNAARLLRIR